MEEPHDFRIEALSGRRSVEPGRLAQMTGHCGTGGHHLFRVVSQDGGERGGQNEESGESFHGESEFIKAYDTRVGKLLEKTFAGRGWRKASASETGFATIANYQGFRASLIL